MYIVQCCVKDVVLTFFMFSVHVHGDQNQWNCMINGLFPFASCTLPSGVFSVIHGRNVHFDLSPVGH